MQAHQYQPTFGYKAQDGYYYGPNGIVGKYHRGNDRPTPTGTPVVISGTTIGLTGATGKVSGPHLHTQACTAGSNYADDFDPSPFEFKNGTVVGAGWHSQFGNHIVIRVGGVDITYAHLSKINVQIGQKIGVDVMTEDGVRYGYLAVTRKQPTQEQLKYWIGRPSVEFTLGLYKLSDSTLVPLMNIRDELTKTVKIKDDEIKRLNAQLAIQTDDTKLLNSLGEVLVKLIARIGVKK